MFDTLRKTTKSIQVLVIKFKIIYMPNLCLGWQSHDGNSIPQGATPIWAMWVPMKFNTFTAGIDFPILAIYLKITQANLLPAVQFLGVRILKFRKKPKSDDTTSMSWTPLGKKWPTFFWDLSSAQWHRPWLHMYPSKPWDTGIRSRISSRVGLKAARANETCRSLGESKTKMQRGPTWFDLAYLRPKMTSLFYILLD